MFQEENYRERRPVKRDNKNNKINSNNNNDGSSTSSSSSSSNSSRRNIIIIIIIIIIDVSLSLFVPFTPHVLAITEQKQKVHTLTAGETLATAVGLQLSSKEILKTLFRLQ